MSDEISNLTSPHQVVSIEDYYKITKSNILIESIYKLTALEQKVILIAISIINPDDEDLDVYRISINAIAEVLNLKRKDLYSAIKELTFNILKKPIRFRQPDKKRELQANWFSSCEYKDNEGIVEFRFDKKLKPHLLKVKENFTSYSLGFAVRLKSKYAIRLYELLKRFEFRRTITINISELRNVLGLEENDYKMYGHFKQRVLDYSKKEINEKTDITFSYKELKTSKKVDRLQIIIRENKSNVITKDELDIFDLNPLCYELMKYKISEKQAREIIESCEVNHIKDKIGQLEYLLKYNKEKVKGEGSYLYNAIKDDWVDADYLKYKEEVKKEEKEKIKKERERDMKKLLKEYNAYCRDLCVPYDDLPQEERRIIDDNLKNQFEHLSDKIKLSEETLNKMKTALIEEHILEHVKKKNSFEEWIQKF